MLTEEYKLAVKRGAVWLDDIQPNWAHNINLCSLNMNNCTQCILGQLMGNYFKVAPYFSHKYGYETHRDWAVEYGFNIETKYEDLPELMDELSILWEEEVNKRR